MSTLNQKITLLFIALPLLGSPTFALDIPNQGYYSGLSILYPYKPVYCPEGEDKGSCYGSPGELEQLPLSAPLPIHEKWCVWADSTDKWYQWKPRISPKEKADNWYSAKICYFQDRGKPHNINDLERD